MVVPGCNLERLPAAKSRLEAGAVFRGATIRRSRDLLVVGHHHAGLVPWGIVVKSFQCGMAAAEIQDAVRI